MVHGCPAQDHKDGGIMPLTIRIGAKKSKMRVRVVRGKKPKLNANLDINIDDVVKAGEAIGIRLGAKR